MANLFGGLSVPQLEDPRTLMFRAQAAAEPFGRSFLGGMAIGQRATEAKERLGEEQRQFNLLEGFREAQLRQANANIESLKARAKLDTMTAENAARVQADMGDAAELSQDIAIKYGYGPAGRAVYRDWVKSRPWMANTPWAQNLEENFGTFQKYEREDLLEKQKREFEQGRDVRRFQREGALEIITRDPTKTFQEAQSLVKRMSEAPDVPFFQTETQLRNYYERQTMDPDARAWGYRVTVDPKTGSQKEEFGEWTRSEFFSGKRPSFEPEEKEKPAAPSAAEPERPGSAMAPTPAAVEAERARLAREAAAPEEPGLPMPPIVFGMRGLVPFGTQALRTAKPYIAGAYQAAFPRGFQEWAKRNLLGIKP